MLKLYGNPRSRTERCLWMLEETGEPYELVRTSVRTEDLQSAAYLQLNPNARIPTLVDGEIVLWESMAINLYLAQRPGPMHSGSAATLGLARRGRFYDRPNHAGLHRRRIRSRERLGPAAAL